MTLYTNHSDFLKHVYKDSIDFKTFFALFFFNLSLKYIFLFQAVGGVLGGIAQVLTVLGAAKCVRKSTQSNQPPVHLHIGFALLISNLLLLLAVHVSLHHSTFIQINLVFH